MAWPAACHKQNRSRFKSNPSGRGRMYIYGKRRAWSEIPARALHYWPQSVAAAAALDGQFGRANVAHPRCAASEEDSKWGDRMKVMVEAVANGCDNC